MQCQFLPSLVVVLIALAAGGGLAAQDAETAPAQPPQADPPAGEDAKPRVIVRVDRTTEVKGHIELEEEDVIVVRTPDGEVRSFAKGLVLRIVRLVEPEPGQTGVVVLESGQMHEGVILEDDFDHVLVEIEGIEARFRREVVDYVVLNPTFREQYEAYKAALKPEMAQRRLALCRWLVDERRYDLAEQELTSLLDDHELPEARRLLRIVRAQLALREKPPKRDEAEEEPDRPEVEADSEPNLISEEDVNIIRVFEIDFANPPRVVIRKETIERLINRYGTNKLIPASQEERERLYRADPIALVRLMFELRARDLYGEIEVLTEPHALDLFRRRVHDTFLMNNCATSRCHGGPDGGRLILHRRNSRDARVRYTNLLILERLELDPQWPLINYQKPLDSLLIQYGLPPEEARMPHPPAPGWKPVFRRASDRMVRYTQQWMRSMFRPRPDYPVEYEPPTIEGADADETGPEGQEAPERADR
ncbi:MAG: hypothetical protein SYC29_06665 [Planctomycetota bacterium]|nr:hypothetical protein [Planctomycetota bacterium]